MDINKISKLILFLVCFFVNSVLSQTDFFYESDFLSGFEKELNGETINYYTLGKQALDALLVRSMDKRQFIEWETEAVKPNENKTLTFVMMASLQVNKDSHQFDVFVNDKKYFSFKNPINKSLEPIILSGVNNSKLEFSDLEYDRFEDLTGFLYFHLPSDQFVPGKPIKIRIEGESADSRSWFMVFKHKCKSSISLSNENVMLNANGKEQQSMRVKIFHAKEPEKAIITIGNTKTEFDLKFGFNFLNAGLEKIYNEKTLPIEIKIGNKVIAQTTNLFKPISPITVYLIPHSHVDIGYTNIQDDVRRLQWSHIDSAIVLAEKTKDYPSGSKFKWNVEVLWALESYLDSCSSDKKEKVIKAIQDGSIGVDGMYANMLTGLCSPEEWIWLMEAVRRVNEKFNIKIESAMISDIPGWSWSIVPVLANAGIKYLSFGINQGDRIGSVRRELGDKPFYWISPSSNQKILTWVHEQGYSAFHYIGKSGTTGGISEIEPTITNYINSLAESKYPYDIVPLRYTIGSDNGPTDKYLSDNVKKWNEKYLSPKLVIATNSDFFKEFENKYKVKIPEFKGDITPYWEDGAGSSANETAINRQSADKLNEAMYLLSQYSNTKFQLDSFYNAWRNVILYDEHTWGSWNSISEPESDFTKQQWRIKQLFALQGKKYADNLLKEAVSFLSENNPDALEVINTTQFLRTDIAKLPDVFVNKINSDLYLVDDLGNEVPTQILSDGSVIFLVKDLEPFSSKRFYIGKSKSKFSFLPLKLDGNSITNDFFKVSLDKDNGYIKEIYLNDANVNYVNNNEAYNLGEYIYVNGRKPENPITAPKTNLNIVEQGPILTSYKINYDAEGCNSLEQEIKIISGVERIELNYSIDKQKIYTPEAIRLAFPINLPDNRINIENAFGYYQPGFQQIKGSCKNFYTVNNYLDMSNNNFGMTIISPDAPLFEIGKMTNDANIIGWLDEAVYGNTVYSFLMNNYWHTNFCATQEGKSNYRFILYPHKEFDPVNSAKQSIFVERPLVVLPVKKESESFKPFLSYDNLNISIISMQPIENDKYIWITLYNSSDKETKVDLKFINKPKVIYESDLLKNKNKIIDTTIKIPRLDLRSILVEY